MRKESRVRVNQNVSGINGYHCGSFEKMYYYNSDRRENLTYDDHGHIVRENGQPLLGWAVEVETECRGVRNERVLSECLTKIVFPVFKFGSEMFKQEHDGSLGGDIGDEIITQIMTKQRIRNDYRAYQQMFDVYFPAFGISADSFSTACGMHINVSNGVFGRTEAQQTEAIKKLYYFINKHYELALRLFYRDPRKTHWCGQMDYRVARNLDLYHMSGSHGNCLNLSHFPEGRIEIRIVGGQKKYVTFRNTMETAFFLCERMKSIRWADLDDYVKVFSGCNQYVFKRLDDCRAYITQDQMDAIESAIKEEDLELRR